MKIAVIPGDGIGVDVTREALKVLEAASRAASIPFEPVFFPWSADHYLRPARPSPRGRSTTWAGTTTRSFSARSGIRAFRT